MLSIRKAAIADFDRIMAIYSYARDLMIRSGNPSQWGHSYPMPELVLEDIESGICHVICDEDGIHGVFALIEGEEPTYQYIEDGRWLNDEPYVTIHRIAGDGQVHGIVKCVIDDLKSKVNNIRIDTHENNLLMQRQIEKNGFRKCGIIYVEDGTPRIAYQWTREKLWFGSDYQEGACPEIMDALLKTNFEHSSGYGTDYYSQSAREKIRTACHLPDAEIYFLSGGTQTNQLVIDTALKPWQGVIAARTGHISTHEAGAIEFSGHKVLELPQVMGKLSAEMIHEYAETYFQDENRDHMVAPGMVYLSQPTEYGTIYSLAELEAIRRVCDRYDMLLYIDGARLAYGLACPENDVSLPDLAELCDIFYIGGTKCGALFGEAVVIPEPGLIPHLFTMIKQHGALLAKGRIAGLQFDTLFTDDLYVRKAQNAIEAADRIRKCLYDKGYRFFFETPTNQIFIVVENRQLEELAEILVYGFWERYDEDHTVIRLATSWATSPEDVEALLEAL